LNILLNHFNLIVIQSIFSNMAACLTNAESILPFAANPLPNHAQPCRKDWAHVEGGWKESKQNWKVLKVHRESWEISIFPDIHALNQIKAKTGETNSGTSSCFNDPYHSSLSVSNSDLLILHHDYIMIHLNLPDLQSNTCCSLSSHSCIPFVLRPPLDRFSISTLEAGLFPTRQAIGHEVRIPEVLQRKLMGKTSLI